MIDSNVILSGDIDDWMSKGKKFQLIDITPENLLKNYDITSDWIPAGQVINHLTSISRAIPVILCCYTGESSFIMMNILHLHYHMENIFSLKSGIYGWETLKKKT